MLFHLKYDWESKTKKVEDLSNFPTGIYFPSTDQWFRSYDPWKLTVPLNFCSGQH
jgi:hypothetical protein